MNERIKQLRKTLGLTLEKFSNRLGVGKTAISKLENNENNLTQQMFKAICREFNVNEEWLRDGTGEMFRLPDDTSIRANAIKWEIVGELQHIDNVWMLDQILKMVKNIQK